jgi:hypothetical protein
MNLYRQHFLGFEAAAGVLLSLIPLTWMIEFGGASKVDLLLTGNRAAIYGALATIFGSLLGFVITAVSILVGVWGVDKLTILRESKHATDLWRIFTSTTKWVGLATLVSLAGLVGDRDLKPIHAIMYATIVVVLIGTIRLCRCIWALERIVAILAAKKS